MIISKKLKGLSFYVFGSATKTFNAHDIDLLIEYDENNISIQSALQLRVEISQQIALIFQRNVDVILLSKSENMQSQFIKLEKGVLAFTI